MEVNVRITVLYDNKKIVDDLIADWGFSCFLEAYGKNYLFDTGSNADILLRNMKMLNLDDKKIDAIFISHPHLDHTGGLRRVLRLYNSKVYVPYSFPKLLHLRNAERIRGLTKLDEHLYSTGELRNIEQSLLIKTGKGVVVIIGCGHPGIRGILDVASGVGNPIWIIGGLHGFNDFEAIRDVEYICPMHCTFFERELKNLYPEKYVPGGVGKVIEIED